MKYHTTALLAAAAAALITTASASPEVVCNQGELGSPGQPEVCKLNTPPSELPGKDAVLPCVEVIFRDNTCHFGATEPNYSKAHAECMCNGTNFVDWIGCQQCLLDHGFHSEDNIYWSKILSAASEALCTGTPTAAVVPSFPTPVQTGTLTFIPVLVPPSNGDGCNQLPLETDKKLNQTAAMTQVPWAINQTSVAITEALGPQKTCIGDVNSGGEGLNNPQNINTTALATDVPASTTVAIIPIYPTDSLTSVVDPAPPIPTSDSSLLPPGIHSSSESSDGASSFERSGLAMAIAGGIMLGVL
ncbi:hypothetical protein V8C37DRAFT_398866 [Trichoderma ceciliae]